MFYHIYNIGIVFYRFFVALYIFKITRHFNTEMSVFMVVRGYRTDFLLFSQALLK